MDAATERCAHQSMQSLSLPPPSSLPLPTFGRHQDPSSPVKSYSQFSPGRPENNSYPSPPMSDSHSPARRSTQLVEPERHPYPPSVSDSHRTEGILPPPHPPPSIIDPRPLSSGQSAQRPLYPGELQPRGQPLHYQPGRAIEPPSYGGTQNYSYGYPGTGVPPYLGNQSAGPQGQPAAMITPQALRPHKPARRTKAHVASACVNCKKAHLSCDVQRPCGRCVASGKQDTCKDVQHKKRGRPRLRDDKEFSRGEEGRQAPTQLLGALPASGSSPYAHHSAFPATQHSSEAHGALRRPSQAQESLSSAHPPPIISSTGRRGTAVSSYGGTAGSPYSPAQTLAYQSLPVAFLNLDLVIQKSNPAFQDLIAFAGDLRGKSLLDLVELQHNEVLGRLRNDLRDERDEREPTYMAPITPIGQDPMQAVMQSVSEQDVDSVSHGFTDRPIVLNFHLGQGQYHPLQTLIRLAKTSLYFVTLVVHTRQAAAPRLLTQQLAPPTPVHASQTLSAPTVGPTRDFTPQAVRPPSSASSAPTSPYLNFSAVRTSLPNISPSSYGNSSSYSYSPTTGSEQGYFPTIRPPTKPDSYPSPYPPVSRTASVTSDSLRELARPSRLDGLQLPPIRTGPGLMGSPSMDSMRDRERTRPRESPSSAEQGPETPETGKRRRLNIHEVLQ